VWRTSPPSRLECRLLDRQTGNTYDRRHRDDAAHAVLSGWMRWFDFAIIYPTAGLRLAAIVDDETRRA